MFLSITDSFHGFFSFVLASGWVRKAHPGGCILPVQYVHGSVPGDGELTWVVLYVVVLESCGACGRCEDYPVAFTLLPEGLYVKLDVVLEDVWDGEKYWRNSTRFLSRWEPDCRTRSPISSMSDMGRLYEPSYRWCWNLLTMKSDHAWSFPFPRKRFAHRRTTVTMLRMSWVTDDGHAFSNFIIWNRIVCASSILSGNYSQTCPRNYTLHYCPVVSATPRNNRTTSLMSKSDKGIRGRCRSYRVKLTIPCEVSIIRNGNTWLNALHASSLGNWKRRDSVQYRSNASISLFFPIRNKVKPQEQDRM